MSKFHDHGSQAPACTPPKAVRVTTLGYGHEPLLTVSRGTFRGTVLWVIPAHPVLSMRFRVPSVQLAHTLLGAGLLVNGRSAVRMRSPAPQGFHVSVAPMFTFGPGVSRVRPLWAGFAGAACLVCCSGAGSAGLACLSWGCLVMVPGLPSCQGGVPAVARSVRVLRRRRRVLGGRPAGVWRAADPRGGRKRCQHPKTVAFQGRAVPGLQDGKSSYAHKRKVIRARCRPCANVA